MSTIFGRYQLINHIARKDQHDVYLACHLDMSGQLVVLKVFDTECLVPGTTLRDFQHVIQKLQQLIHPSILTFHSSGIEQGKPYIVSKYILGESLRTYLDRSQRLPVKEAVKIVRQIGEAVAFAHSQQIIHQDIRPENIFSDPTGNTILMDFRLPHLIYADYQMDNSTTGMMSYKAPEQLAGKAQPAVDQYALGCLLYELTTGRVPFPNKAHKNVIAPKAPTTLVANIPQDVEVVMLRALSSRPTERFKSVTDFLIALKATLQPAHSTLPFAYISLQESIMGDKQLEFPMTPFVLEDYVVYEDDHAPQPQLSSPLDTISSMQSTMPSSKNGQNSNQFLISSSKNGQDSNQFLMSSFENGQSSNQFSRSSIENGQSSNQLSQPVHIPTTTASFEKTTSAEDTPAPGHMTLVRNFLFNNNSNQFQTNYDTDSMLSIVFQPLKKRSLMLLAIATLFVLLSTFLSPVTTPTLAQVLTNTPDPVASPSNAKPISKATYPTPTATQPAPTPTAQPTKSPTVVPGVTPTAPPKKNKPHTQPTTTTNVPQPQPTVVTTAPQPQPTSTSDCSQKGSRWRVLLCEAMNKF